MTVEAVVRARSSATKDAVGTLERLPKWLNLVPIVAQWLWLSLRYRSISLPSASNPAVTTGGMVGEGKMEYLAIMGPHALSATATTTSIKAGHEGAASGAVDAMKLHGLDFPIVVKPDLGWCGYGVRRVDNPAQLERYLDAFPRGERVVVQEWVDEPGEAGIFYIRRPSQETGEVIGMLLRHFPRVVGDGRRTVNELIASNVRTRRLGRDGASEACCDLGRTPPLGEAVRIATVSSTRVGGLYEDGTAYVTTKLATAIDAIARDMKDFHVGRFDIKFATMDSLCSGAFTIIEVNGAGSEAVHAWDPKLTLTQAYRIIFGKQRRLFEVGEDMRRLGHRPVGWLSLAKHHLRQQRLISRYPPSN